MPFSYLNKRLLLWNCIQKRHSKKTCWTVSTNRISTNTVVTDDSIYCDSSYMDVKYTPEDRSRLQEGSFSPTFNKSIVYSSTSEVNPFLTSARVWYKNSKKVSTYYSKIPLKFEEICKSGTRYLTASMLGGHYGSFSVTAKKSTSLVSRDLNKMSVNVANLKALSSENSIFHTHRENDRRTNYRLYFRSKIYPYFFELRRETLYCGTRFMTTKHMFSDYLFNVKHPSAVQLSTYELFKSKTSIQSLERWTAKYSKPDLYHKYLKLIWRYFRLKIERYFFTKIKIKVSVYFYSIWKVFIHGIGSHKKWRYFENAKISELTRRGSRFLIELREDAKFFTRIAALTLILPSGIKIFTDKVARYMRKYRNHWAYVRSIMKFFRSMTNFFWFRYFINYKITLQGKIDGQLRCRKKTYKRGMITIEDWSTAIAYRRSYPKTKVGIFNLSFWIQYRIPDVVPSFFNDMRLVSTMDVLLNRFTLPFLVNRLKAIIDEILEEERKVKIASDTHRANYIKVRKGIAKLPFLQKTYTKNPIRDIVRKRLFLRKKRRYSKRRTRIEKNLKKFKFKNNKN